MTTEQLHRARAALWRQDGHALLTNEDARGWLEQHPLCLFLPHAKDIEVPAPSFVEACLGERNGAPTPEAVERAQALLQPLLNAGSLVMLNLLGAPGVVPDFLVHVEILPWVFALAGDREWKQPPQTGGGRPVTQLALDLWKLLEKDGPATPADARQELGGELTEAAVLNAFRELWRTLRVSPAGLPGETARWELLQHHHRQALQAGLAASQVTALSLLVSTYLQSVYAAAEDEVEEFLSPLASRSRIREAVRGLATTRQVRPETFGTRSFYLLEGTLEKLEEMAGPVSDTRAPEETLAPVAELEPAEQQTTSGSRREGKSESDTGSRAVAARSKPKERRKPKFEPRFEPGRGQIRGRRPEPKREQRPERRREQSGWRKLSSEESKPEGGREQGKGWERPKRSFSGSSRPWPPKDRERAGSEQRTGAAEGRNEPRRQEFKPSRFGGKFTGKPKGKFKGKPEGRPEGRPFRSGGEQGKGWERPKRSFSGSSRPWPPKDRERAGSEQRGGRAEGRDDVRGRKFTPSRFGGKPRGDFKGKPFRGTREQGERPERKFGGQGRFQTGRSQEKKFPEGANKGWKRPAGETAGRPDKPGFRSESRGSFSGRPSGRYSKPFGGERRPSGKRSDASPAGKGRPWQGGKGNGKKKPGKGFGPKRISRGPMGASKGFSRKKGPQVKPHAPEEPGNE